MKSLLTTSLLLVLAGCGNDGLQGLNGAKGLDGAPGAQGPAGSNGTDGLNSLIKATRFTSDTLLCPSGAGSLIEVGLDSNRDNSLSNSEVSQASVVCDGLNGVDGHDGANGADGQNGQDGTNGTNGQDAVVPQYSVTSLIDPCGDAPGIYDEVGLRLANGSIIFLFMDNAGGHNTRLSVIGQGSYVTTDGTNCNFSIDANNVLTDQNGNVFNP